MSAVDWTAIAIQVAMAVRSPLLESVSVEDRLWLAVDGDAPWNQLSHGEQCVLRAAHWLCEIGHALAHVDAELRADIEDFIFTALRDTPETIR